MTHAVANSWLFLEDLDYETRIGQFRDAVDSGRMRLHSYCLMGNHEHLLITVAENALAPLMQRLNRSYAGYFNRQYRRRGRVYGSPYESVPVVSSRHLVALIPYLALNPEKVDFGRAESYRWSSYPALVGVVQQPWFIDAAPLLDVVGGSKNARRLIVALVDEGRLRRRLA